MARMDSLRIALTQIKLWLAWLPDPLLALAMVALALVIAISLHKRARQLLRRLLADRHSNLGATGSLVSASA